MTHKYRLDKEGCRLYSRIPRSVAWSHYIFNIPGKLGLAKVHKSLCFDSRKQCLEYHKEYITNTKKHVECLYKQLVWS